MTETMTGNDDVELPLVKAVLAATSLLESHREKATSCTSLLEMAGHRGRVGMIWAFTAGFIVSAVLMVILVFNPFKRDAEEWRSPRYNGTRLRICGATASIRSRRLTGRFRASPKVLISAPEPTNENMSACCDRCK